MRSISIAIWLVALLLGFYGRTPAQNKDIVHLHTTLRDPGPSTHADTAYVDTLNRLSRAYYGNKADSAFLYARAAQDFARKTGDRRGESEAWRMLGNTYEMVGDYVNMLTAYQHSLDIAEKIGNTKLIGKVEVNMALFAKQEGEYAQAQRLMEKVAAMDRKNGDSVHSAYVASHLADLALRQRRYDEALQYAEQAYRLAREMKDEQAAADYNNDVGRVLAAKGDYQGALTHHLQSLGYFQEASDWLEVTATKNLLAQTYLLLKDYAKALRYARESLSEAGAQHRKLELEGSAKVLADIYAAKGDYRQALHYYKLYNEYSDSRANDQSRQQILTRAAQYDYEQQASALREAQAVKNAGYERELRLAQLRFVITISVTAGLFLLAFLLLRGRIVVRKMNRILKQKNTQIEEQKRGVGAAGGAAFIEQSAKG